MQNLFRRYGYIFATFGGYILAFLYPYLVGVESSMNSTEVLFQLGAALLTTIVIHLFVYKNVAHMDKNQLRRTVSGVVCIMLIFAVFNPIPLPQGTIFVWSFALRISLLSLVLAACIYGAKEVIILRRISAFLVVAWLQSLLSETAMCANFFTKHPYFAFYVGALVAFIYWIYDFVKHYDEESKTIKYK